MYIYIPLEEMQPHLELPEAIPSSLEDAAAEVCRTMELERSNSSSEDLLKVLLFFLSLDQLARMHLLASSIINLITPHDQVDDMQYRSPGQDSTPLLGGPIIDEKGRTRY